MTIHLTPELEAALDRRATRLGRPAKDLAIEILRKDLDIDLDVPDQDRLRAALAALLAQTDAVMASGDFQSREQMHMAEDTGAEFTKIVMAKHRKRNQSSDLV